MTHIKHLLSSVILEITPSPNPTPLIEVTNMDTRSIAALCLLINSEGRESQSQTMFGIKLYFKVLVLS